LLFLEHITCVINVNKQIIDVVFYGVLAQTTGKLKHVYQASFKHDTYIWMGGGGGVSLSSSLSCWYRSSHI